MTGQAVAHALPYGPKRASRQVAGASAQMDKPLSLISDLERCWEQNRSGETESALRLCLDVHNRAKIANEDTVTAMSSQAAAQFLRHLGRSDEGVEYIQKARRIWTQLGNLNEQARSGAIFAWLLMEFGDDDVAATEATEAYALAQTLGDETLLAFVGDIYAVALNQIGDHEAAAEISGTALEMARRGRDGWELAGQLIDRGYIFTCIADRCREMGDDVRMRTVLEQAVACNDEAIAVAEQHSDYWKLRIALSNGADLYVKLGDYERAESYLEQWRLVPGTAHGRLLREYDYANCELLVAKGKIADAISLAEHSVEKSIQSGVPHQESNVIMRLSSLYEQLSDYKCALKYHKIYHNTFRKMSGDTLKRRLHFLKLKREIDDLRMAVDQSRKQASALAEEALIDPLTGIANRRAFDRELQRLINANEAITLALLDLDHFKLVNDEYSHVIGDDVLQIVGRQLKSACRSGDVVARFGGEEFAFIFEHTRILEAAEICERLRASLSEYPWDDVAQGLRVTVSVGISSVDEASSVRELLEIADGRLYAAKIAGRNCVVGNTAVGALRPH